MKKMIHAIILCAVIGVTLSAYAFLHNRGFASGKFCTLNATINCDIVNKGPFSEFFGIPVALIGFIGYLFILIAAVLKYKNPEDYSLTVFLLGLAYGGFGFSLYLTSIEATILHAWCLVCVSSQIMMLVIMACVTIFAVKEKQANKFLTWFKNKFALKS